LKDFPFEFDFDSSISPLDPDFIIIPTSFTQIISSKIYKPDPEIGIEVILTDFTSITKPTSNGEKCEIPFSLNEIDNYFCAVDNTNPEGPLQCNTTKGLANCILGNYDIFVYF